MNGPRKYYRWQVDPTRAFYLGLSMGLIPFVWIVIVLWVIM